MYAKQIAPGRAPKQFIEPSQDISQFVNGPESSGVSSDPSFSKAGDTHPMKHPYPTITKLPDQFR